MKLFKKLMVVFVAVLMVMSLASRVYAEDETKDDTPTVTIEITRDDSYAGDATQAGRTYKYYKVFTASYESNTSSGGGHNNGDPGNITGTADAVAYTASSTVAAKLGSWIPAAGTPGEEDYKEAHWEKVEGNEWFDLTPIAGTTNYSVRWSNDKSTSDVVQEAAQWLFTHNVYDGSGTALTFADGKWTATGLEKGYYLVESATGKNLIAATTDVKINEKNAYPPLDKTQADEDNATQNNETRNVAVGDKIDYEVKVTIPATAKVGEKILVWDKASTGLSYNNDVDVKTNAGNANVGDYTGTDKDSNWAWCREITVTKDSLGKDVVFKFSMTVTSDALIDSDKENESGLKYGQDSDNKWIYEGIPDKVEYKTYFAGIEKIDGKDSSIKLENVEFTLKEDNVDFKVTKVTGKDYYVPDANGSATVKTAADGTIRIRGLDDDKTYTLTETNNPNAGYNMMAEAVTLTLHEDTTKTITYTPAESFTEGTEYYIKGEDGSYALDENVTSETFESGKYYTKTESESGSYDGATVDTWQDVVNNKGALLPSTGGIGTTIFHIAGAALVLGAGILLISKKRMNNN